MTDLAARDQQASGQRPGQSSIFTRIDQADDYEHPFLAAVGDGQPLMPRLDALGVTAVRIPGLTVGALDALPEGRYVLVLPQDSTPVIDERLAAWHLGRLVGYDEARPMIVTSKNEGVTVLTFDPRDCGVDHGDDLTVAALSDIYHRVGEPVSMELDFENLDEGGAIKHSVLSAQIGVDPYSNTPTRAVPHVDLTVFGDEAVENLDPEQLAEIVTKIRRYANRLDVLRMRLVQVRAEWTGGQA